MKIGSRLNGVHVEKYLITESRFELIDQTPSVPRAIGAAVADKNPGLLARGKEIHIRVTRIPGT